MMSKVSAFHTGQQGPRGVIDMRSPQEKAREARALEPLDEADEKVARELAQLSLQIRPLKYATEPYDEVAAQIRRIGEDLCANGGTDRMDLICYRVAALCRTSRYVRMNWDGVCGWQF